MKITFESKLFYFFRNFGHVWGCGTDIDIINIILIPLTLSLDFIFFPIELILSIKVKR